MMGKSANVDIFVVMHRRRLENMDNVFVARANEARQEKFN